MSIQPHLNCENIIRFASDDIENSLYAKTVEYMREDDYFFLNQAMQEIGLKKINLEDLQPGHATAAIATLYDEVSRINHPHDDNHYYTFGWSALMSHSARYKDSERLLAALVAEVQKMKAQGINPKIRIIGYSHGGNVCLNLAAAYDNSRPEEPLHVDELILVAVPLQTETEQLVANPLFKRVYNLFSDKDRVQPIDFFSRNRFLSRKTFKNKGQFKKLEKLTQVEFKFTRKVQSKRNNKKRHDYCLDFDNPGVVAGRGPSLRDCSPGHLEFWFFGWSPRHYRPSFIMHPLPCFIVLPYIIHQIKELEEELINPYVIIADIRPEFELMVLKQRDHNTFTKVLPFLSHSDMNELRTTANKAMIDSSFEDEYFDHLHDAFIKGQEYFDVHDLSSGGRHLTEREKQNRDRKKEREHQRAARHKRQKRRGYHHEHGKLDLCAIA
jgi:pimeloyl-ACP methyl ester carboxylesterase